LTALVHSGGGIMFSDIHVAVRVWMHLCMHHSVIHLYISRMNGDMKLVTVTH